MNFDFSEDQKLLQQTARDYLAEHAPLTLCREVLETDASFAKALWQGAAEMGWLGAAIPEEYGGAGFGRLELAVIAEEIGRALAPIPFGSSVYLATEALLCAGSEEQKQRLLWILPRGGRRPIRSPGLGLSAFSPGSVSSFLLRVRWQATKCTDDVTFR